MGCGSSNNIKQANRIDQSIWRGSLTVHLRKATVKKDFQLLGKMDPYIKVTFGKQQKTSTVCDDGGQFPTWKNESFTFTRTNEDDVVYLQMWNKNLITSDDFMGEGGFALTKVRKGTDSKIDATCILYGKSQQIGEVDLALEFDLLPECKDNAEVLAPDVTGQLIVRPQSAVLLRDTTFLFGSMSPICVVKMGDDYYASGANMEAGTTPKWEDQLIFTRDSLQRDTILVEIQNFSASGDNDFIGVGFLSVTSALVPDSKPTKTVDLYFEGTPAGNCTLELEYVPDCTPETQQVQQSSINKAAQAIQQTGQAAVQMIQTQFQQPQLPQNGGADYRYPNGDMYRGFWVNGIKQGQGRMDYRTGMIYEGDWMNDQFHGEGTLMVSGTTYVGQFANGKKNGQGTITWENSQQKYSGQWLDNKYHGIGEWTHPNGQTQKGEFQYNNRIRWIEDQPQHFLEQGRCLMQGGSLPSDDGQYTLMLAYNGFIQVMHNQSRQITFQFTQFQFPPQAPFFLRLEMDGRLNAIDGSGRSYYYSRMPNTPMQGQPPFKLIMQNDGKIAVHGAQGPIWYSH